MSSRRRVFALNNCITFNDYINSLKGKEIFQNLKSTEHYKNSSIYKIVDNQITGFLDYNTFLLLTRSYFKAYGPIHKNIQLAPKSIMDAYSSYLCYNDFISHIGSCNYCSKCDCDFTKITQCLEAKNILYPYGIMDWKDLNNNDYFNFPTKLVLPSHTYNIKNNCDSRVLNNCGHKECYGNCNKIISSQTCYPAKIPNNYNYYNNYFGTTCYEDKCIKKCKCVNICGCGFETCNKTYYKNNSCCKDKRICSNGKPLFLNKSCYK
jgi:hypothetical protein